MKFNQSQRTIAGWSAAIAVSILVIAVGWSFRPDDSSETSPSQTTENATDSTVPSPFPRENEEDVAVEDVAVVVSDLDAATAQLAERVSQFESGYRSIYRSDTPETRLERVRDLVASETLEYLNFEQSQPLEAGDLSYDIVASAIDPEATIDGLALEAAQGEITLSIAVSYTRVEADGQETPLGTLLKRSRWSFIDGEWLLSATDT